jgi:hypothetical protein
MLANIKPSISRHSLGTVNVSGSQRRRLAATGPNWPVEGPETGHSTTWRANACVAVLGHRDAITELPRPRAAQRLWNRAAECLGSLQIDDRLNLRQLFNGTSPGCRQGTDS